MKKVIYVHLSERVFQIEEDAYTYLQSVISGQWKKQELEAQVAEKLHQKLNAGKMVITYPDVVDALYQLGLLAADNQATAETKGAKKLYRQMKDKVLGGVCTGLAEYLEIDPVVLRVLFVIAAFFGTIGFWMYLILWIVVPKAPKSITA